MDGRSRWMRITEINPQKVPEIRSFRLDPVRSENPPEFDFIPGQFVQISSGPGGSAPFAIASAPEDRPHIELLIKREKGMAGAMFDKSVGNQIEVTGPHGKGFPVDEYKGKNLLLLGVGTGIAPLRSVLRSALRRRTDFGTLSLIYGALTPRHLCYTPELQEWDDSGVEVCLTVTSAEGNTWTGYTGFVQDVLRKTRPRPIETVALLVGMNEMIQENTRLLLELGFPKEDILLNY